MDMALQKSTVRAFYQTLYSGESARAADYLSTDYVEHQASAGFSRSGLLEYVQRRRAEHPAHEIVIHRTIAQADLVFLHVEEKLDRHTVARGELFRIAAGRIAEHWSAHVIDKRPRKNPHGTFDGPDVDTRQSTAARAVEKFQELDQRGFGRFEFETFYQSRTQRYIQHSPTGGDTVQGLVDVLRKIASLNMRMTMDIKRTLTEGDFIVSHRLYRTIPPYPDYKTINVFDLFRMTEGGQADEHWDIMEEIESQQHLALLF
jgi:predicted SnoaL-like aldol condensation-catalyzing enzyme